MTSQVIRSLESKGLITREVDVADTRARRLVATATGTSLAPAAIAVVEAVDAALLNRLLKTRAGAFTHALRQLRD